MKRLLSVSIRTISRGSGHDWSVEFIMYGTPVANTNMHSREQGKERPTSVFTKLLEVLTAFPSFCSYEETSLLPI